VEGHYIFPKTHVIVILLGFEPSLSVQQDCGNKGPSIYCVVKNCNKTKISLSRRVIMSWPSAGPSRRRCSTLLVTWTVLNVAVGRFAWACVSWTEVDLITVWIFATTTLIYDCGLVFNTHDVALPESCQIVGILSTRFRCSSS
jgi:hypothetical protein